MKNSPGLFSDATTAVPAKADLFLQFRDRMPANDELGIEAANVIAERHGRSPDLIKKNFSRFVSETEAEIYRVYKQHEERVGDEILVPFVSEHGNGSLFQPLDRFFLSIAQSRKSRAGSAFEGIIRGLFRQLGYPFEEQRVINGKPDFILPSEAHFRRHAVDCIIFTAKRTLRERWRQIVTEGTQGAAFFLATLDDNVTEQQLSQMLAKRVYVVVPESLKQNVAYRTAPNVISFEEFFVDHLDPAVERWCRRGLY